MNATWNAARSCLFPLLAAVVISVSAPKCLLADEQTSATGSSRAMSELAIIRKRLRESKQLSLEMTIQTPFYQSGHMTVDMDRPTAFVIESDAIGDNPRCVYWLKNSELIAYEEWRDRGARGIVVQGLPLTSSSGADDGFKQAIRKAESFAYPAHVGLDLMRILDLAPDDGWMVTTAADLSTMSIPLSRLPASELSDYLPLPGIEATLIVTLQKKTGAMESGLSAIAVAHKGDSGTSKIAGTFSKLEFVVTADELKEPSIRRDVLKSYPVSKWEDVKSELIDSLKPRKHMK